MSTAIVCSDLTFAWPDGHPCSPAWTWLSGRAAPGCSASTDPANPPCCASWPVNCARRPVRSPCPATSGTCRRTLPLRTGASVSDVLGIAAPRAALHAIERGEVSAEEFTAVGDDWDVEERAAR